MNPLVWILIGVVLGVIEVMSTTFVLMWIAFAAIVTGLLSFVILFFEGQIIIFALLSTGLLLATRPLVKRWRSNGRSAYVSNIGQLAGQKGIIVAKVEAGKTGMVKVGSDVWSARAKSTAVSIDVGVWVDIIEVNSSILVVTQRANQKE